MMAWCPNTCDSGRGVSRVSLCGGLGSLLASGHADVGGDCIRDRDGFQDSGHTHVGRPKT